MIFIECILIFCNSATLTALQALGFYAMTAINYPNGYTVHLNSAQDQASSIQNYSGDMPNVVANWRFTRNAGK